MKMLKYILIFFLPLSTVLSQPLNRPTTKIMLETAEDQWNKKYYYNALDWYTRAYKDTKDKNLAIKLAECYDKVRDYNNAEKWYSKVVTRDKKNSDPGTRITYGKILKMNGKYQEALDEFLAASESANINDSLKAVIDFQKKGIEMAKKMKPSEIFVATNAGKEVNSAQTESSPIVSTDGKMFFTSLRSKEVIIIDGKNEDYHAKAFTASADDEGKWGKPNVLSDEINRPGYHTGNIYITTDGSMLYFTRAELEGNDLGKSMIYASKKDGDSWGAALPVKGSVSEEFQINNPSIGELFGRPVLFFSSNMPGGKGGYDLYYANLKAPLEFAEAINLGDKINTAGDEVSPFYIDGRFYFSSDGHPGFGAKDIFTTSWTGSGWGEINNLGKPFNSGYDDAQFTTDQKAEKSFLVSNRPGGTNLKSETCCDDIFMVARPRIKVDLNVITLHSAKPLNGTNVQLVEMTGGRPGKTQAKDNKDDNKFSFVLESGKSYILIGTKQGFIPDTSIFNTEGIRKVTTLEKKLILKSVKKPTGPTTPKTDSITVSIDEPIRLNNIYYDYDDDKILTDAEEDLNQILGLMKQYPDMVIELGSHTDARGKDSYNLELSQRRANSAKNWLTQRGVVPERIVGKGYGETVILNQCFNNVKCTDEEHRFNRRTEFKILKGPTTIRMVRKEAKKK
jgi:peptidoglycan-associated lipoprotein